MGGYAGLAFADKYPSGLRGLSLFHSHPFADTAEKRENRRRSIRLLEKYGHQAFVEQMIPGLFAKAFRSKSSAVVQELIRRAEKVSTEAYIYGLKAMISRPDRTFLLSDSRFPFQFIIGKQDMLVPVDHLLEVCYLPKVRFHTFTR